MSPTALVTGAAGFVGSNLTRALLDAGWTVVGVDSMHDMYDVRLKWHNLSMVADHPSFSFHRVDVRHLDALLATFPGSLDVVVHLAAMAGVRWTSEEPPPYHDVNVVGTATVVEAMRRRSVPRLVFASSSSVYGVNPHVPWAEDAVPQPISRYAESKLAAEQVIADACRAGDLTAAITRLFTVYGPGQRPDLAITAFATRMLRAEPIVLFGDGSARRDFTYVDDIVDGLRAAMVHRGEPVETFNLSRGKQVRVDEVIRTLEEVLGRSATVRHEPEARGDVPQTWGSVARSAELLGYAPTVGLTEGIGRSVPWFELVARTGR